MTIHYLNSPSGLSYNLKCVGRRNYIQGYPDEPSLESIDGTHSHTLLETAFNAGERGASRYMGLSLQDEYGEFTVDAERAERVQMALDFMWALIDDANAKDQVWQAQSEQTVDPGFYIGRNDFKGTLDLMFHNITTGHRVIADFKDGRIPVHPMNNDQLMTYAIGAFYGDMKPGDTVELVIVQPKIYNEPVSWVVYYEQLVERLAYYEKQLSLMDSPDAPRTPGFYQCQWCPGNEDCPERAQWRTDMVKTAFAGIQLPVQQAPSIPEPGHALTPAEMAKVLDAEPVVIEWFKEVRAEATRLYRSGTPIPDHKLVYGDSRSRWIEDKALIGKKLASRGLNKSEIYEDKLRSINSITGNKKLKPKQIEWIKNNLVVKPQGAVIIVPESDRRQAIAVDPKELLLDAPSAEELTKPKEEKEELPSFM